MVQHTYQVAEGFQHVGALWAHIYVKTQPLQAHPDSCKHMLGHSTQAAQVFLTAKRSEGSSADILLPVSQAMSAIARCHYASRNISFNTQLRQTEQGPPRMEDSCNNARVQICGLSGVGVHAWGV